MLLAAARRQPAGPLDARCAYRIGARRRRRATGRSTLYDADGRPVDTPLGRSGFTSAEILRDAKGGFSIVLSREPQSRQLAEDAGEPAP